MSKPFYFINSSIINTTAQLERATMNKFSVRYATTIPKINAAIPEYIEFVAERIAGKVITVSVTYGT